MADVELVIKVPEHCLEELKCVKLNESNEGAVFHAIKCILNGTPLPKGHGKLIDATILRMGFVVSARFNGTWNLGKTRILSHIDDATAIIEADKESERYY